MMGGDGAEYDDGDGDGALVENFPDGDGALVGNFPVHALSVTSLREPKGHNNRPAAAEKTRRKVAATESLCEEEGRGVKRVDEAGKENPADQRRRRK